MTTAEKARAYRTDYYKDTVLVRLKKTDHARFKRAHKLADNNTKLGTFIGEVSKVAVQDFIKLNK